MATLLGAACPAAATDVDGKLITSKRIRFGEQVSAPASIPVSGWSFDARAGARVRIRVAGAKRVRLRGPKVLGGDWNTPWTYDGAAARTITFQVPRSGRYGVFAWASGKRIVELTLRCVAAPCSRPAWPRAPAESRVYIIAVGDTGLQPHRSADDALGGYKYGEYHLFTEMVEGFERFLDDGDLNVVNVETAVTSRGRPAAKRYNFRMHANGLRTLATAGFDAFAMANNHAGDYGPTGIKDGLMALEVLKAERARMGFAGIGHGRDAAIRPHVFERSGVRIAFASVGFGFALDPRGPYMASLNDLDDVLGALRAANADVRILSAHFGSERKLVPGPDQRALAQKVMAAGIDILHGHHPHVVQGIERIGHGIVLYSVGNFLLRGARNMGTLNADMDYGAAVRLGLDRETYTIRTLEVVPLYDMHRVVFPLERDAAARRIMRLNRRSASLGTTGVELRVDTATGYGVAEFDARARPVRSRPATAAADGKAAIEEDGDDDAEFGDEDD
ncbi:MAG: CapA family protein [Pseudomonadota bacterium]